MIEALRFGINYTKTNKGYYKGVDNINTIIKQKWKEYIDGMTWSFSRLNSFSTGCKYCWFERYGNEKYDGEQNAFAEYGTLMHEILEELDNGNIMLWDAIPKFEEGFVKIGDFPPLGKVNLRETYYRQGIEYLNNYRFDSTYEVISVEERVNVKINGNGFTGFIDKLMRDKTDGKLVILDHKSKSKFKSKKEQQEYARQLYLYAYAVKEKYGEYPKMLLFNMFRYGLEVPIFFKEKDMYEAIEWMDSTIEEIKNCEVFPVTNDKFFREVLCEFRYDKDHKEGGFKTLDDWNVGKFWDKVGTKE